MSWRYAPWSTRLVRFQKPDLGTGPVYYCSPAARTTRRPINKKTDSQVAISGSKRVTRPMVPRISYQEHSQTENRDDALLFSLSSSACRMTSCAVAIGPAVASLTMNSSKSESNTLSNLQAPRELPRPLWLPRRPHCCAGGCRRAAVADGEPRECRQAQVQPQLRYVQLCARGGERRVA